MLTFFVRCEDLAAVLNHTFLRTMLYKLLLQELHYTIGGINEKEYILHISLFSYFTSVFDHFDLWYRVSKTFYSALSAIPAALCISNYDYKVALSL